MKKILFITSLFFVLQANAQENEPKKDIDTVSAFNRWSVDAMFGKNRGLHPFESGYYSEDPGSTFGSLKINSFDLGIRYMFNPKFGLKLDMGYNEFTESDENSLPFETNQFHIGLQGVVNAARILDIDTENRFGLLLHGGMQMASFTSKTAANYDVNELKYGFTAGITPQYRIAPKLAVLADVSMAAYFSQELTWNGTYANPSNNSYAKMATFSLGLSYSLGSDKRHGDWKQKQDPNELKAKELQRKIDDIEVMLQDTDRDGVVDYLDVEPRTTGGVTVDTKGRAIDVNKNGIPDELESNRKKGGNNTDESEEEHFENLIKAGIVNVFFDTNKETPTAASANNIYYILNFLRNNPEAKVKVKGFADVTGDENMNKELAQKRAQNITDFFIYSGIDAKRIEVLGVGVDTTMGGAKNKTGLQLSRRVSFELIK
ncbi:outer membrane protein, OmpA/MotB family [Flavobacterium limnosediminis JC2902]|uniref:Outer membrane protein, OmpA/MotB family n=1 Tax=Flavobacterium limnosediminis JC2902 TaxID=1341181 RepID=V6SKP7_9FLAO|nr:OmpA family protein [Flavobacterium limnosediminis]ESU27273.1 outer membrane protein, OmpA/MotB family [Flavobacterium limnosediminis JC2902]